MRFLNHLQSERASNLAMSMSNEESLEEFLQDLGASIEMQNKIQEELETNIGYSGLIQLSLQDQYLQSQPKEKKHKNYTIKKKTEVFLIFESLSLIINSN